MKKSLGLLALAFLLTVSAIGQITVNGITLPAKLAKNSKSLTLNGAGERTKYFIEIYALGLYLPVKESNAQKIINMDETMGVRLTFTSGLVSKEKMAASMREGFEKSMKGNTTPLQKEIDYILKMFLSKDISEGDTFDIFYSPDRGVFATMNGKALGDDIKGLAFKKALFGIWIGEDPIQSSLKEEILGLD